MSFIHTLFRRLLFVLALCAGPLAAQPQVLRLATTTSTENSGLLAYLLPAFEQASGYRVHVIAVGTGKALRMGRDGDVDVVLVHAPAAERTFVAEGAGILRRAVMHNDFVVVGPHDDPAKVRGLSDAVTALRHIAQRRVPFLSRGDDSGTHKKELALWRATGIRPSGFWYREVGQGMGRTLQMANELGGYTLSDRGTWLAFRDRSDLRVLVQGDPRLFNPYHIIAVNPQRHPGVDFEGAKALIDWITGPEGQRRIAAYRLRGEVLFHPDAQTVTARNAQ